MPTTSDKPQTLAEQPVEWRSIDTAPRGGEWFFARTIRGTIRYVHFADKFDRFPISHDGVIWETDPIEWTIEQPVFSAIADAAATTTPAEHAGDVRQSWRVKPLVWYNFDAWTWWAESTSGTYRVEERNGVWRATLNLPMTEHVIYEYETDGTPNDFAAAHLACQADHTARITSALEPDPTPALSWRAMQTFACEVISAYDEYDQQLCCDGRECGCQGATVHQAMRHYIKADPGPTDADLDREALNRPVVQAMRTALQTLRNLMCEAFEDDDGNSGCGLCENDCTGCIAHFALAKIGEAK